MTGRTEIHIERLVLRGVPNASSRQFVAAFTSALQREHGIRRAAADGRATRPLSARVARDGTTPTTLAEAAARAVIDRVASIDR